MVTSASFKDSPRRKVELRHRNIAPDRACTGTCHVPSRSLPSHNSNATTKLGLIPDAGHFGHLQRHRFIGHLRLRAGTGNVQFKFALVLDIFLLQRRA